MNKRIAAAGGKGITATRISAVLALSILLWGCTTSSTTDERALHLKSNEGLLGLVLINRFGSANFQVKLSGFSGSVLKMNDVHAGENLYLYKLGAGKYCLQSLYLSGSDYFLDAGSHAPCFKVVRGMLTYGGTLSNIKGSNYLVDMGDFLRLLKETYPKVYTRYVTGDKTVQKSIL